MTRNATASLAQLKASDPSSSAWVNANAGSGKTHVLVDRVIRLLLAGTEPAKIMCLTFTKAAAAEMSNRLFERLSVWVSLDDDALRQALAELGNANPGPKLLQRARQLFTRALETPGGLKIQTIHAFCERVLQAFPVEAGIVPRFTVLDDRTSRGVLAAARDSVFLSALQTPGSEIARAIADVVNRVHADSFEEIMKQVLSRRADLHGVLDSTDSIDNAMARLRARLGIGDHETPATVLADLALDKKSYREFSQALATGTPKDRERGAEIANVLMNASSSLMELRTFYLTKKDEPRAISGITTKAVAAAAPWLADFIGSEQQRLVAALGKLADLERLGATRSLYVLGGEILHAFEAAKRQRGAYDFDDLIIRTGELLGERPDAAWVLYKLDGGIEHLLVDEAQDTSPAQWQIIKALTSEFFVGAGRHGEKLRTVFAVGDRKQSIYSFQGADPDIFERVHGEFAEQVKSADQVLRDVDLTVSFRSAPQILEAVDAVFSPQSEARKGLDGKAGRDWSHQSNRRDVEGVVELWPLIEPEDDEDREPWTAPVDREPARSPRRRLAAKLATTIKSWIGNRVIASLNRAVRPEDILVLVRVRNVFFDALIRELRQRGVPVAGADRLKLTENIAVLDLLALAQFCIMPEDDHALACILKSPILARPLTEEQLMAIAIGRGKQTLWSAVQASSDPACAAAAAQLGRLAAMAPAARPFEFFAGLLVNARMRFLSRLGSEANDALDALLDQALDFEDEYPATLAGFLNWFAEGDTEIKRNMEQGAGEVRIMTVHGAKGLEAPIVILPDTVSMPTTSQQPPLLMVDTGNSGLKIPLWPLTGKAASSGVDSLKGRVKELQAEEYRRLLYVAMTRARDELYVCGYAGKTKRSDVCWYSLVSDGLKPLMREIGGNEGWRLGPDPQFRPQGEVPRQSDSTSLPEWAGRPTPVEVPPVEPMTVSSLIRKSPGQPPQARAAADVVTRGIAVHRMLQRLPDVEDKLRLPQARAIATAAGFDEALADEVLDLLAHDAFSTIFMAGGLSEIPLMVDLPNLGGRIVGRIDRLVVEPDRIAAIDYKTSRRVPADAADADSAHVQQMAAYREALRHIHPGARIDVALLYTEGPKLIWLPDDVLDRALDHIAVNRP